MKRIVILSVFLLTSCTSTRSGRTWWNPSTYFSGSAGTGVTQQQDKLESKENDAIKAAHVEVVKTGIQLSVAPKSPEVDRAIRFNDNATAILNQATGSLTLADLAISRAIVFDLGSADLKVVEKAENAQGKAEKHIQDISRDLADINRELDKKNGDLEAAFKRENAVANKYRNAIFGVFGLGTIALLLGCLFIWCRFSTGGIPKALGGLLGHLQKKDPSKADELRDLFDKFTNRGEQSAIRAQFNKSINS